MKPLLTMALVILSFLLAGQNIRQVWSTGKVFDVPESVYYYAEDEVLFVSNVSGKPTEKNGRGFISKLSKQGKIIKLIWIAGLNAPKGMAVLNHKLYVSDIDRIVVIDIDKGFVEKFIEVPGAGFLNDMVFDGDGNLYVSDMTGNAIYRYSKGRIEKWLSSIKLLSNPNGMAFEKGSVLIGTGNGILKANPKTKQLDLFVKNEGGIDGLIPLGNNRYAVSDWYGKIQIISPGKKPQIVLNTTSQKINAADLGFISESKILLIPTFFNNTVVASLMLNN